MKILVLQLARLGDIYLSWPALRALRRQNPSATIDVLTRSRFQSALEGCEAISNVRVFATKSIMEPLIADEPDIQESYRRTDAAIEELKCEKYDWIINLSFSPASSYIAHSLSTTGTRVTGYTRSSDGYLAIPDDMSAYFYAQVGPGLPNRFHLAEVFGTMVGMDLVAQDWAPPSYIKSPARIREGIVIHVGASEAKKTISSAKWAAIINQIRKVSDQHVILIGAKNERSISDEIMNSVPTEQVKNMVGETSLMDVFRLIEHSALLIGADSAPIHIASLTDTPCLNLSLPAVNFWETGPRSSRSFILRTASEEELPSDRVADVAKKILEGRAVDLSVVATIPGTPSYRALCPKEQEFQWRLLKAIYLGEEFPESTDQLFISAIEKLAEVNQLILEQMKFIDQGGDLKKVAAIIDRGEEIIETIAKVSPSISPLIRWYQTEKLRIGPDEQSAVLAKTIQIHELLEKATSIYYTPASQAEEAL